MSEAATPDDAPEDDADPFAEMAEECRDDLEELADSDLPAAWVAKAILKAEPKEGE